MIKQVNELSHYLNLGLQGSYTYPQSKVVNVCVPHFHTGTCVFVCVPVMLMFTIFRPLKKKSIGLIEGDCCMCGRFIPPSTPRLNRKF